MNKVTKINPPSGRADYRKSATRFTVYRNNCPLSDVADEFYNKHNIGSLKFKCRAWSRVGSVATREEGVLAKQAIMQHCNLKDSDFTLRFDRKAGCSCGCSPGFVGQLASGVVRSRLSRADVWVDLAASDTQVQLVRDEMARQERKLP